MTDVVEILVDGPITAIEIPVDAPSAVEIDVPGIPGPSPLASRYDARVISPVAGVLTIDLSIATTFLVNLTENVTSIVFTNAPAADEAQGVFLFFQQDGTGGRTIASTAWPSGRVGPAGAAPILSTTANALDVVVVNAAFAAFGLVAVTLVARDYRAF